ncbi:hypothetical protein KPL71_023897 [Citrus sinensis]|uniref:Uncharacterized protein n=1 Tax=Citrus sinensis TaxID=2711 RepID=A0ACB8IP61_CITSI|nr:hypothetical protein KPL71_023897 [Citrus sinensis]
MRLQGKDFLVRAEFGKEEVMKITGTVTEEDMRCALQATQSEQYVTLEIPTDLVSHWKREGYTHLHLGGVRLIRTLHGRKRLPVTARLALLDTRFKEYQHAVIGTVLTTLHAGSVLLTFYPNFNLSLDAPNLPTTLKVQIQLQGAEQIFSSKMATLHHRLVYRLQNHALDLPTPQTSTDALMILVDSETIPSMVQIPRKIQKQNCPCLEEEEDDDFNRRPRRRKKRSHKMEPCQQRPPLPLDDPDDTTHLAIYKKGLGLIQKEYQQKTCKQEANQPNMQPIQSCMMFSSSSYQEQFPLLEKQTDAQTKVVTKPFVQSPVTPTDQLEEPRPFKAVLNWQAQNARAQNSAFRTLGDKIERVAS